MCSLIPPFFVTPRLPPCVCVRPVISHLSVGTHAMDEEGFQRTICYIFTFIKKVRVPHATPPIHLYNPLLGNAGREHRREAVPVCQWRDIVFCLLLLPFKSEHSVKKLIGVSTVLL